MKKVILFLSLIASGIQVFPQDTCRIRIDGLEKEIIRGHLELGGSNPAGDTISVNSYYIEWNGRPFFPVIGELHYSRTPAGTWEESILKMKAGGINTVATYVFWNIHERREGSFDWQGDLNLRRFLELVEKCGLHAIVRMGPFCHGEMRNGGLPDWLYGRPFEVRSNDPGYLQYVDRLYGEIAGQLRGMLFSDGGPVIAIQLENEYQHSAAPWEFSYPGGPKEFTVADWQASLAHEQITVTDGVNPWADYGRSHMQKLKEIAQKHGLALPLYTATGWGNAAIVEKGSVPVTAAYVYPFWAPPAPSPFYLFKDIHQHPDYSPVSYEAPLYPSIPGEVGPGIQVKYSRRPVVDFQSVLPLMVRIIGSGSNGIGYYMYHGGSTPTFDGKFYNEEVNGLPRINYDFQAPIGQYGQTRPHYHALRMLHLFLESYGERLAPMRTFLPEGSTELTPENTETPRYAVRASGGSGFVFFLNYQDHLPVSPLRGVRIEVEGPQGTSCFPPEGTMELPAGAAGIFPFRLELEGTTLLSATVQPLTILEREPETHHIFRAVDGITPQLLFPAGTGIADLKGATRSERPSGVLITGDPGEPFSFSTGANRFLVLPEKMALNTFLAGQRIWITEGVLLEEQGQLQYLSRNTSSLVHTYPGITEIPLVHQADIRQVPSPLEGITSFRIGFPEADPGITITRISEQKYTVKLDRELGELNDLFLEIDYTGDRGLAFINGEMITDHFYHERSWEIGLRSFTKALQEHPMVLIFHPMQEDMPYLDDLQKIPDFTDGSYLNIRSIAAVPEYRALIHLKTDR
jgi:hypothetical protein